MHERDTDADCDAALCGRIAQGDGAALGVAYDVFGGVVYAVALRVTRSQTLAEDVTQEVFVELWQRPDRFDGARGGLRTYLCMLAHRRSVDQVRSHVSRARREERFVEQTTIEPTTEDVVLARLASDRARESLLALPSPQRECLELAFFAGLTYKDVAARLGISEGTAKSRIRLALQRLRRLLGETDAAEMIGNTGGPTMTTIHTSHDEVSGGSISLCWGWLATRTELASNHISTSARHALPR